MNNCPESQDKQNDNDRSCKPRESIKFHSQKKIGFGKPLQDDSDDERRAGPAESFHANPKKRKYQQRDEVAPMSGGLVSGEKNENHQHRE
jgi:hypothetical protein